MEFKFLSSDKSSSSTTQPPPPHPFSGYITPPMPTLSSSSYIPMLPLPAHPSLTSSFGHMHPDVAGGGNYLPNPSYVSESFLRELKKHVIREELISVELERRRELEEEVRREMLVEKREMMTMGLEAHAHNFQMPMKASNEAETPKIIHMPKPEANISGMKRKAEAPPPISETNPLLDSSKIGLHRCELCQVNTTSKENLQQHLRGRKHQNKEAKQASDLLGKNFKIGLSSKKVKNSDKLVNVAKGESLVLEETLTEEVSEKLDQEKKDDVTVLLSDESEDSIDMRFWCEICRVGAFSEKVMHAHLKGEKHTSRLLEIFKSRVSKACDSER